MDFSHRLLGSPKKIIPIMILTQELLGDGINHSIFLPHFLLHLAYGGSMLPRAVPRGDAPKGVRLERHPDVEVPKFVEPSHYDLESLLV